MHRSTRRTGFSVVELIVVVAIIGLLMGLLLPALGAARTRARKTGELSNLREVGRAWTVYANMNRDAILPGYLSTDAQEGWHVSYRFQDGTLIPPAPDYPKETYPGGPPNVAGPWPWRLMPYLDHREDVVYGYQGDASADGRAPKERAWDIRERPAFGYNGLFVGGWWIDPRRPWYSAARRHVDGETGPPVTVVSRSIGSVRRSSELLIFASAAERDPGLYKYNDERDDFDGTHTIIPPTIGRYEVWGPPRGVREGDAPAGEGRAGHAPTVGLDGVHDVLHVYGSNDWEGNPFEFG